MSDWQEVEREGEKRRVRTLVNGSEIHDNGCDFSAYDSKGRYLGFCGSEEKAAYMAEHGYCNIIEEASDLSLWTLWNDVVNSGETVLTDPTDEEMMQFIILPGQVVMSAKRDEHGWETELLDFDSWWDTYRDERYDMLALVIAEKPYVLE